MKKDTSCGWQTAARSAAMLACAAVLVAVAAGCSSQPTSVASGGGGSSRGTALLAYARCVQTHGVPGYPDPDSDGSIPKRTAAQLGVTDTVLQSAQSFCNHMLPNGGSGPSQSEVQEQKTQGLKFAKCMREHGIPLPDPDGSGRIPDPASVGIDQGSPKFQSANQDCGANRPAYIPSNAAYNAWARTQNG
jgi:hypothetical protein